MGVYTRFKRAPDGFRALVQLLETTPLSRRQRMIDVGMAEDPDYTQEAMAFMISFEDILRMPDMELAELLAKASPRVVGAAIHAAPADVKTRFFKCCKPAIAADVRDYSEVAVGLRETGGAQLKLVEIARQLEQKGLIKTKRIPEGK